MIFFLSIVKFYFNLDAQPAIQILNLLAILNGPAAVAAVWRFAAAVWCQVLYSSKVAFRTIGPSGQKYSNSTVHVYIDNVLRIVIFRASQYVVYVLLLRCHMPQPICWFAHLPHSTIFETGPLECLRICWGQSLKEVGNIEK